MLIFKVSQATLFLFFFFSFFFFFYLKLVFFLWMKEEFKNIDLKEKKKCPTHVSITWVGRDIQKQ